MDQMIFLQDLAIVMAVSAVIIVICQKFHLPVVLGYILAGVLIGPNTPPFPLVKDLHNIHILSELGVIFLLFSIGLEFSLRRLARVGLVSFFAATFEILVMIWIGYALGRAFGWTQMNSLFLGAILSISSTTIIAKVLIDTKKIKEQFAQVILGILIVEDLIAIVIIAILSGVAATGSLELGDALVAMGRVTAFVAGVLIVGLFAVPPLLRHLSKYESKDVLIVSVLGLCFGVSLLAARLGFSVALGAFLIGAVIAETKQVKEIVHQMEPLRDMFTAIFFVSVGLLISPQTVAQHWVPILILTVVTVLGKTFSCTAASFLSGYDAQTSLKVGLGLAQIGEFSFIIARLGETSGVTSDFMYPIAVAVSAVTTLTTPILMRGAPGIERAVSKMIPKRLATAGGLYTGWFDKIRNVRSRRKTVVVKSLRFYVPRLVFYAAVALIFFFGISAAQNRYQLLSPEIYKITLGLAMFPLFIGGAYMVDRLLWNVVIMNLAKTRGEGQSDVDQVFHNGLRFVMALVVGLVLFAAGSIFLPPLPLGIAIAGFVLASGIYLWGSIGRAHERIEKTVLGIFDAEKPAEPAKMDAAHDELVRLIHEEYPWEVATEDFLVPFNESAINRPIKELRLRSETGATIVSVWRDEESMPNPSPEMKLQPGDVVLLMGDKEQIKAGIQFLHKLTREPAAPASKIEGVPKTVPFTVPAGASHLGKALRDIRVRRKTGATVLGIQKEGVTINNPDPAVVLEAGDVLALFGLPDQIEKAVKYLST